ncbi:hypothetical protein [Orbus mooreae]|uniref:hypothetical protein n=1 Tax=Orbus mooreae TaxID=3074107 RepID=UPI00370D1A8F
MLKKYFMLFAILFFIPICFADSLSNEQANSLELAGVKLGMTEPQLIQLLKNKYKLADTDFIIKEQQMKLPSSKLGGQSSTVGTIKTYQVTLAPNKSIVLSVRLEEDIMHQPVQMVVFGVDQSMPCTAKAKQEAYEALVKQYGKEQFTNIVGDKLWHFTADDMNKSRNTLSLSPSLDKVEISIVTDQYRQPKIK